MIGGVVLALALVAVPAFHAAADRDDHERARAALQAGEVAPLRDVLAVAENQFEGEMVEAELERKGPHWVYEITVLTPTGSILKLHYDAATTKLVRARGHRLMHWYKGPPEEFPDVAAVREGMRDRMRERWARERAEDGRESHGPFGWFRRWWHDDAENRGDERVREEEREGE